MSTYPPEWHTCLTREEKSLVSSNTMDTAKMAGVSRNRKWNSSRGEVMRWNMINLRNGAAVSRGKSGVPIWMQRLSLVADCIAQNIWILQP